MGYYSPVSWVDNVTAASAANMNHLETGVQNAVPRTGPTSTDTIDYNLNGGTDVGIMAQSHVAVVGGLNSAIIKVNNYYDGTNDRFISASTGALQLRFSATGIAARKNTNTPGAGSTVTWGSDTFLYGS